MRPYVNVRDLRVTYRRRSAFGSRRAVEVRAVDGIDLQILAGETVALVGGSGSGKTTTGKAILHLVRAVHGTITVGDFEVSRFERAAPRAFRRDAQMVFQNIVESLNPAFTVAEIIGDPLRVHFGLRGVAQRSRVLELLDQVGLEPRHADVYRHGLSVGQRQRVTLARALATEPRFIVLDEPVSALDGSTQGGIIALLERLQHEHAIAYLFITHDLAIARHVSSRISVMRDGRIVEAGPADQICERAEHPYTRRLVESSLGLDP